MRAPTAWGAMALLLMACGASPRGTAASMAEMDRVRAGAGAREAQELAPQAFAHADEERVLAKKASDGGDDTAASIYADRAIAAYSHAFILARLARATRELSEASSALAQATEQERQLASSRAAVEREGDELDKQLKIAREAMAPAPSGPADASREAARLVAARALATQGRLLCGAAHLLSPSLVGLAEAEKALDDLDKELDAPTRAAPIDPSARARANCLGVLTKARRASEHNGSGQSDALLSELAATAGWDPARDERGVVVTMRGAFKGIALTTEAEGKLTELGRVAAAHPAFAVQIVIHDATAPSKAEAQADAQRGEAASKALTAGGAAAAKVKVETAAAKIAVADPNDAAHRPRNARMEIVFISPTN